MARRDRSEETAAKARSDHAVGRRGFPAVVVGGSLPVVRGTRLSAAWGQVRARLLDAVLHEPRIEYREGARVQSLRVRATAPVGATTADGNLVRGDVSVGADGVRSVVRSVVTPGRSLAAYAGYVAWRALFDESAVPGGIGGRGDSIEFFSRGMYRMTIYCVPGADGSTRHGSRRICFAWYDGSRNEVFLDAGVLTADGHVVGTLPPSRVPPAVLAELDDSADGHWPDPWNRAVRSAIRGGHVYGTPIAEYVPDRIVRARAVILGDAARLASPVTGAGFLTGLRDIESLARRLRQHPDDVPAALAEVESDRLADARRLVRSGMGFAVGPAG